MSTTRHARTSPATAAWYVVGGAYLILVVLFSSLGVDAFTRALIALIALLPFAIVAGAATRWRLMRRQQESPLTKRQRRAVIGAIVAVSLGGLIAFLIGLLS